MEIRIGALLEERYAFLSVCKGKDFPIQAQTGPYDLRLVEFVDDRDMMVVWLSALGNVRIDSQLIFLVLVFNYQRNALFLYSIIYSVSRL
jgi:hypothetical protein